MRSLAWRGRLLVIGFAQGEIPQIPANLLLIKGTSAVGVFWGDFARREPKANGAMLMELFGWLAEGRLRPHVSKTFGLQEVPAALRSLLLTARRSASSSSFRDQSPGSTHASVRSTARSPSLPALVVASSLCQAAERSIDKEVVLTATPEQAWQAWTTRDGITSFFAPDAKIEPRVGGAFEVYINPYAEPRA